MSLFLNAKGWQLFLVLFGTMLGAPMFASTLADPIAAMALGTLVFGALYLGWLCSIAIEANRKVDPSLKRSPRWMIIGLAYAAAYIAGALVLLPGRMETHQGMPGFVVPMHLLAMVAMVYALLFTAKRLVTLERKQEVAFFDYSGPFFLLWFFPIGVWFVQPKVNKLLGNQ